MAKQFVCEADGYVARGEDDDELIAVVDRHVQANHPDLVGKLSREEVLAMAEEV